MAAGVTADVRGEEVEATLQADAATSLAGVSADVWRQLSVGEQARRVPELVQQAGGSMQGREKQAQRGRGRVVLASLSAAEAGEGGGLAVAALRVLGTC